MNKTALTSRGKIRIILYFSALFIVLSVLCVIKSVEANRYKQEAMLTKQMALIALDENLSNISSDLEKTIYVSTPTMLSKLSAELWRESSNAKNYLSMLPTGDTEINNIYKFLSQIGEYVMSLERKSSSGEKLSDKEREELKNLYDYSEKLNLKINQMCHDMQYGSLTFENPDISIMTDNNDISNIGESFNDTEQTMTDIPTLIYDGPFSDHLLQSESKALKGLKEVSEEEAKKIADRINPYQDEKLITMEKEDGDLPCYVFKGERITIGITQKGGRPCYMLNSDFSGEIKTDYNTAVKTAKAFLDKIGYENMKETYYYTDDGVCTVNFAYTEGNTVIYTDLIKVNVCLETGKVLSFDASGYLYNHTDKRETSSKISIEQAENILNDSLEIIDTQKCIIPTEWGTENLCYEIHCRTDNDRELLVYIDCLTGEEDNILILLYSDGGVLTK